jgi:hypothetical protein
MFFIIVLRIGCSHGEASSAPRSSEVLNAKNGTIRGARGEEELRKIQQQRLKVSDIEAIRQLPELGRIRRQMSSSFHPMCHFDG